MLAKSCEIFELPYRVVQKEWYPVFNFVMTVVNVHPFLAFFHC